ncbi:MAG: hypothetical protein PUA84_09725 [Oscillospiraceae bacterium]|nr:hypothetical protein [Oscillospiraceae bacterium]
MKRILIVFICAFMLCIQGGICVSAEETSAAESSVSEQQTEEKESSRGMKIAGFLVIFTVAMGVTAYITAAPKLKMLKKNKQEKDQMQ